MNHGGPPAAHRGELAGVHPHAVGQAGGWRQQPQVVEIVDAGAPVALQVGRDLGLGLQHVGVKPRPPLPGQPGQTLHQLVAAALGGRRPHHGDEAGMGALPAVEEPGHGPQQQLRVHRVGHGLGHRRRGGRERHRLEDVQVTDHGGQPGPHPGVGVGAHHRLGVGLEVPRRHPGVVQHRGAADSSISRAPAHGQRVTVLGVAGHVAVHRPDQPQVQRQVGDRPPVEVLARMGVGVDQPRRGHHLIGVDHLSRPGSQVRPDLGYHPALGPDVGPPQRPLDVEDDRPLDQQP